MHGGCKKGKCRTREEGGEGEGRGAKEGMRGTRRMTSGRMDDDMPDTIRRNEHTKKCRHTMPEKWTEKDGEGEERRRAKGEGRKERGEGRREAGRKGRGKGEERGIAGIPARTGHTQETGIQKLPHSTGERGSRGSAKLGGYGRVLGIRQTWRIRKGGYLTSSKSTSSAVGLPLLEPVLLSPPALFEVV